MNNRLNPSAGNIISLAQFALISIEGFLFTTNFGRKQSVIPIKYWFITYEIINNS
jgi:UDP-xylose/UDP-N-acetylglucosamine transporter B4